MDREQTFGKSPIAGLWNRNREPISPRLVASLGATRSIGEVSIPTDSPWIVFLAESRPATGAHVSLPEGPTIVFDGRLHNRQELIDTLRGGGTATVSDAELVAESYRAFGQDFAKHLQGDFALALFDPEQRVLLLARDLMGTHPLFYGNAGHAVVFASSLVPFLAHPEFGRRPDERALAAHLFGSDVPLETTFLAGVSRVLPGEIVAVHEDSTGARRFSDLIPKQTPRLPNSRAYAENFRELLDRAVSRRLDGKTAVLVSGGLDSSSIYCLARERQDVVGVSYSPADGSPADESEFLEALEQTFRSHVERVPVAPPGVMTSAEQQVATCHSPFLDEMWGTTCRALDRARDLGAGTLLTGLWGDQVLFNTAYLLDLLWPFHWRTVRRHLEALSNWCPQDARDIKRRLWRNAAKAYMPSAFTSFARRIAGSAARRQAYPWYRESFRRRWSAEPKRLISDAKSADSHFAESVHRTLRSWQTCVDLERWYSATARMGLKVAYPFLDRDVVSFLLAIPPDLPAEGGVHKAILREAMRGILPEAIRQRRHQADYSRLSLGGIGGDGAALRKLLEGQTLASAEYLDEAAVRTALKEVSDTPINAASSAFAGDFPTVVGLELWCRFLRNPVQGSPRACP